MPYRLWIAALAFLAMPVGIPAQTAPRPLGGQVLDTAFVPPRLGPPRFAPGTGPVVLVDEAHRNFHTASGRYRPFTTLLERDGFRVRPNAAPFSAAALRDARVLVIANALGAGHEQSSNWRLPVVSAFDATEIAALVSWVNAGGSLLLIADHMPFAGDASALAAAFGVHFANGFALSGSADPRTGDYPIVFRRGDASLGAHAVTRGIDSVASFTGSAFRVTTPGATTVMTLPRGTRLMLPVIAWQFSDTTQTLAGDGWAQGAVFAFGKGRIGVFGEAAMFTAQRKGAEQVPMGMNAPSAAGNPRFVLNLLRWLSETSAPRRR